MLYPMVTTSLMYNPELETYIVCNMRLKNEERGRRIYWIVALTIAIFLEKIR